MEHGALVNFIRFSIDGRKLYSTGDDGQIKIWDAEKGVIVSSLQQEDSIVIAALSPDGSLLAAGQRNGTISLWNLKTGERVVDLVPDDTGPINSIMFSPNSEIIAAGVWRTAYVWSVISGERIAIMSGHRLSISDLAFSPDGKMIASAASCERLPDCQDTIKLWYSNIGGPLLIANMYHASDINRIDFSSDGKKIISGSKDSTVRVWDANKGTELVKIEHDNPVNDLAVDINGKIISIDNTIHVWNINDGKELERLQGGDRLSKVLVSDDGKWAAVIEGDCPDIPRCQSDLAACSQGGECKSKIVLWILDSDMKIQEACTRLTRNFYPSEWEYYFGSEPYHATCPNLPIPTE